MSDIEDRLARLEQENSSLKARLDALEGSRTAGARFGGEGVSIGKPGENGEVTLKIQESGEPLLLLRSRSGGTRFSASITDDDPMLMLYDSRQQVRLVIGVEDGNPYLLFTDNDGVERLSSFVRSGQSAIVFTDRSDQPSAMITEDAIQGFSG